MVSPVLSARSYHCTVARFAGPIGSLPLTINHRPHMASRRKLPALPVDESVVMSVPMPTYTARKKSQPKYPLYDGETLARILRFLAAYLTEFQMTLERERELAKGVENVKIFAGRIKYREHQVATIRELVKRAYWPQRHLTLVTDDEISEVLRQCLQP